MIFKIKKNTEKNTSLCDCLTNFAGFYLHTAHKVYYSLFVAIKIVLTRKKNLNITH